ncbi:MAG: hypothetical protein AB1551_06750 [Actinomycetota bacterium]
MPVPPTRLLAVVPEAGAETTIVRSGPTALDLALKLLVTVVVVAIGLGVRILTSALPDTLGTIGVAFTAVSLGAWAIVSAPILWSTWRPKRAWTLWVEGEVISVTPARHRAADTRAPAY